MIFMSHSPLLFHFPHCSYFQCIGTHHLVVILLLLYPTLSSFVRKKLLMQPFAVEVPQILLYNSRYKLYKVAFYCIKELEYKHFECMSMF